MVQRTPLAKRHPNHAAFGLFGRFADGLRDLAGLTSPVADPALAIADHHYRGEAKATATLDDLGDPVNADQFFNKFRLIALIAILTFASCHGSVPSGQNCRPPSRAPSARALTRP